MMKKIFFLSLIFTLSSIVPLMAENKLSASSTQIVESNARKFSKTDLVVKDGIFYFKNSDIPYNGKVIYEKNAYINQSGEYIGIMPAQEKKKWVKSSIFIKKREE